MRQVVLAAAGEVRVEDAPLPGLEIARALGATDVDTDVDAARREHPNGFDSVVDATGVPPVIQQGIEAVRRGGTMMIFGVAPDDARMSVSPFRINNDEITLIGSMAVLYTFVPAIELLRADVINPEPMLTHTFPLDGFEDALEAMRSGEGLKV